MWGVGQRVYGLDLKLFHEKVGDEETNRRTHASTMDMFIIVTLEEEVHVNETNSKRLTIWGMDMMVLWDSRGSCCNFY